MDPAVAHLSSQRDMAVTLTKHSKKSYSVPTFLRDREMGKRVPSVPMRARTDFRNTSLLVICEPDPGKKTRVKWLKKNFFGTRASGFLGLSHDGRYLVAVKAISRETTVYFFLISPRKAILEQSIRLDTSGLMWQVRTYFPPIGTRYMAAYVVDQGQVMAIDPTKSSNLEVSIYLVSPDHIFQIQVSTVVLVVPRLNPRNRDKLEKSNVRCHNDGLVLNTGVSLISLMLTDDVLDDALERQSWYICAIPTTSALSTSKTTINLDLGESVSITSTAGTLLRDEVPKGFSLSDVKRGKPELTEPGSSVLNLVFSRQAFNVEQIVWKCIAHALRQLHEFSGCVLCSVRDYEADVNEIVGGVAPLIVLALCEIEVYVNNGQSTNEFFLFSLNIDWNLWEGSYRCVNVQRIQKIGTSAAFRNQWWMLDKYPVHLSVQNFSLDNRFIFLGKHIRSLRTVDGSWELFYKDAESLDMGRFHQAELLNMAVQSTSESSSEDDY